MLKKCSVKNNLIHPIRSKPLETLHLLELVKLKMGDTNIVPCLRANLLQQLELLAARALLILGNPEKCKTKLLSINIEPINEGAVFCRRR